MNKSEDTCVDVSAQNFWSAVRTKNAIEPEIAYEKFPSLSCVPPILEMDYSRILNKPFFVKNITWSTTSLANIVIANLNFPQDFLNNPLVQVPFNASVYYRAKAVLMLQVSGTPMHAGTLIVSSLPVDATTSTLSPRQRMNSYMSAPHVFLSANEATPALLEVPFYVNTKLASISLDGNTPTYTTFTGNYADIIFQVLNPLSAPTGASTSLTVSVHVVFKDLEFYVPHVNPTYVAPTAIRAFGDDFEGESFTEESSFIQTAKGFVTDIFDRATQGLKNGASSVVDGIATTISGAKPLLFDAIDIGRGYLRHLTGLHNAADTTISTKCAVQMRQYNNIVDAPIQLEKMDPYSQFSHYTRDYTFDTARDEMDVISIVSKPQFLSTFTVKSTDAAGKLLWSRPITPFQDVSIVQVPNVTTLGVSNAFCFANNIQTLYTLSRYWRGTIKIHVQAAMSNFQFCKLTLARNYSPDIRALSQVPSFDSIPNLMMESVEFSAGGQVQTFELPYCAPLEQLPNTVDIVANALAHGMYYIYLHQPLVNNGTATYDARFNVYISLGDDFQFFGYNSRPMMSGWVKINQQLGRDEGDPNVIHVMGRPASNASDDAEETFVSESAEVDAAQEEVLFKMHKTVDVPDSDLRPIVSVRDFTRRFTRVSYERFEPADLANRRNIAVFDVASLLAARCPPNLAPTTISATCAGTNTLRAISEMFLGYSGGSRFKVNVLGTNIAEAWYVPPGYLTKGVNASDPANNKDWRSTIPFASDQSDPPLNVNKAWSTVPFLYGERIPYSANFEESVLAQTVSQDKPNYLASVGGVDLSFDTGAGTNRMPMAVCSFEFEIPHMSPYRFVGDSTKNKIQEVDSFVANTSTSAMGHIVVKVATPVIYYPSVPAINADVAIEVFASTDDVGRFGYQVLTPVMVFPTGTVDTPTAGVTDPVILTNEAAATKASTTTFTPYSPGRVVSNATPPVYNYSSLYFST